MGINKSGHAYKGAHSKVSRPKKPGPKKAGKGKQRRPRSKANAKQQAKVNSKSFSAKLVAALALQRGESMDAGMARMCLTVAMQLFEEADLKLDGTVERLSAFGLSSDVLPSYARLRLKRCLVFSGPTSRAKVKPST